MGLEEIRRLKQEAGIPKKAKVYTIPKKSAKRIKQDILAKGDDNALDVWFEDRKKELTGKCKHCGGRTWVEPKGRIGENDMTYRNDKEFYRHCIAHILPKAYFPSVATHPLNYIELCFWGNNCHGNMDNKVLDLTDMNCWDEIVEKFVAMYPFIAKEERKRIPEVLMNYIQTDL
jgi:hypothetical protein